MSGVSFLTACRCELGRPRQQNVGTPFANQRLPAAYPTVNPSQRATANQTQGPFPEPRTDNHKIGPTSNEQPPYFVPVCPLSHTHTPTHTHTRRTPHENDNNRRPSVSGEDGGTTRLPPRRTEFDSRRGRSRIFARGNRAGRCRWSADFFGDLLSTLLLHSGSDRSRSEACPMPVVFTAWSLLKSVPLREGAAAEGESFGKVLGRRLESRDFQRKERSAWDMIPAQVGQGATVGERLARSSPTKTNRAQSPARSPNFRKWESCRTRQLVGGPSRAPHAYIAPLLLHIHLHHPHRTGEVEIPQTYVLSLATESDAAQLVGGKSSINVTETTSLRRNKAMAVFVQESDINGGKLRHFHALAGGLENPYVRNNQPTISIHAYEVLQQLTTRLPTKASQVRFSAGLTRFSHVGNVADVSMGQRVFSGHSSFVRPCVPPLLHINLISPSPALNTYQLNSHFTLGTGLVSGWLLRAVKLPLLADPGADRRTSYSVITLFRFCTLTYSVATAGRESLFRNPGKAIDRATIYTFQHSQGVAVAQWLGRSPPAKAIWVRSPAGSLPDFRMWESCWTILLAGGFSRGTPVSPAPAFQRRSIQGSHFMLCSGTTGTYGSQLESPSLGGCCLALGLPPIRSAHLTVNSLYERHDISATARWVWQDVGSGPTGV
ncbi:hypothetical protein PR048_002858 [Dryococelus australis]|uniref:Uncharacterized protein n=1 Tax=Dryococelus australis TaxID=614101 RepID=A0ABQ9ILE0_9NEOP|nr:hypothetical protein PR048_002858 [Dryococelus australis]